MGKPVGVLVRNADGSPPCASAIRFWPRPNRSQGRRRVERLSALVTSNH
jgi:hypothetical protein